MIYPSIRIEGAILSPDHLDDAADQRPTNFGLDATGTLLIRERKKKGVSWNMG